ncbi:dipeptide epimerase [Bombilactobacillus folatiphilus]|uniref:Dipeptide epimerase n=1 Tax=Bombilactobacillus folatiphilus TaxID=2923362 RepID=A0ABY4P774_9LACO|nr:dipeptide epimerase [Bombilactobacillus folatiphilus]UQS81464.1 dipeptide epimerase [Bombilactobacillus folatiphilus]
MTDLIIQDLTCQLLHTELKQPFTTALHKVTEVQAVEVKITLSNGLTGFGTATPNEKVTGDTLATIQQVIIEVLRPCLLHKHFWHWNLLLDDLQNSIIHNTAAKAAVELALYDLRRQIFGVSLTDLLGGHNQKVITDYTISIAKPQIMVQQAQQLDQQGFSALKIKVGQRPILEEISIVNDIASAVCEHHVHLRIDANQAWTVKETLLADQIWYENNLPIDFIEQPVLAQQINAMAKLTAQTHFPIMADESAFSVIDVLNLIEQKACDFVNIKLMKTGGLRNAQQINDLCATAGISCMIGCMIEPINSITAAVAFASANTNIKFVDLDAILMTKTASHNSFLKIDQNILTPK